MKLDLVFATLAVGGIALVAATAAARPTAIVEEVTVPGTGVEELEYVQAGRALNVPPGARLVLAYLASCVREEIVGGSVTVGDRESTVTGGQVTRTTPPCAGSTLALSDRQARSSGVVVFRTTPRRDGVPEPAFILYGTAPLVEIGAGGTLVIERLDAAEAAREVEITAGGLRRGAFYDFAATEWTLAPDALYRARFGGREVVFRVDALAKPGKGPLLGRLLRFPGT